MTELRAQPKDLCMSVRGRGVLFPLTQGFFAIVDERDLEWLSQWRWSVGKAANGVYARRGVTFGDGTYKGYQMHREIWQRHNGPIPAGMVIDHEKSGPVHGLDNRLGNLRLATRRQNQGNMRRPVTNTSGYKGVTCDNGRWVAQIKTNGRNHYLGAYDDPAEAAKAYDRAAIEQWGEFAHLNFPILQLAS